MNNKQRRAIAERTVDIINNGFVEINGKKMDVKPYLEFTFEHSKLYIEDKIQPVEKKFEGEEKTIIKVTNQTTSECLFSLPQNEKNALLNFASAKNPGGGFLGGASAQEESLARASGLHHSLLKFMDMYERNRKSEGYLYSDEMIYSPKVAFWFDDEGYFLSEIICADIITSPAPNKGAMIQNNNHNELKNIESTFLRRIYNVLHLAKENAVKNLILGAWGCGVFRNESEDVAHYFEEIIEKYFPNVFKQIVFAVYDPSEKKETFNTFKQILDK